MALKHMNFAFFQEQLDSFRLVIVTNLLGAGGVLTKIIASVSAALEFAIRGIVVVAADGDVDKVVSPVVGPRPVSEAVVLGPVAIALVLFDSVVVAVG